MATETKEKKARKARVAWTQAEIVALCVLANPINGTAGSLDDVQAELVKRNFPKRDTNHISVKLSQLKDNGVPLKDFPRGASGPRIDTAELMAELAALAGIDAKALADASAEQTKEREAKKAEREAKKVAAAAAAAAASAS